MALTKKNARKFLTATGMCKTIEEIRLFSRRFLTSVRRNDSLDSYSQCGEDIIVDYFLKNYMQINRPSYLDIGANHPSWLSNTYLFYLKGCNGVCVEPDPVLCAQFKKKRSRDTVLNIGVGISNVESANFYVMTSRTLNSFSREEVLRFAQSPNQKIEHILKIPLVNINDIIGEHFDVCPNFLSLDTEGMDFEILKTFNFSKYRPEAFCIETLTYIEDSSGEKIPEIIDFMKEMGYMIYADTFINTIFIDSNAWERRK